MVAGAIFVRFGGIGVSAERNLEVSFYFYARFAVVAENRKVTSEPDLCPLDNANENFLCPDKVKPIRIAKATQFLHTSCLIRNSILFSALSL